MAHKRNIVETLMEKSDDMILLYAKATSLYSKIGDIRSIISRLKNMVDNGEIEIDDNLNKIFQIDDNSLKMVSQVASDLYAVTQDEDNAHKYYKRLLEYAYDSAIRDLPEEMAIDVIKTIYSSKTNCKMEIYGCD